MPKVGISRLALLGLSCLLGVTSCAARDPAPPWDVDGMLQQLEPDVRHFEELPHAVLETEILAWRIDMDPGPESLPRIPVPGSSGFIPPRGRQVESALLWRRSGPASAPIDWALVQAYRFPDSETPWQRATISREVSAPLTRLRPGEDADGTWHAYHRYNRPPTSVEACDFAAVAFLPDDRHWRRIAGVFRNRAWVRVLGEPPLCSFADAQGADQRRMPGDFRFPNGSQRIWRALDPRGPS